MIETLPPIILEIETPASADEAWAAITDPERVAEWLTDVSALGDVGDPYRLDFGDGSVVEGVIREIEPGRRFAHTWAWVDALPRQETIVSWTVEPLPNGGGRVILIHDGWSDAGADSAARDDHEAYWSGYLDDLAEILSERA
ncbi:MAG: hypothetical protein A2Z32_02290 [Chloroflexi bacterium RBG_16_69_14]|nr:MAG: hypothetical protein A2Z32_02290 [Chloroflexi bacterium RBG_16_69_14]